MQLTVKALVKYSAIICLLQLLTCYEIPVSYSRVAYPQVVFTSSLDTTFYNTQIDSALHASDTCNVRYSKMKTIITGKYNTGYTFGYSGFYDSLYPPFKYFNLSVNDTFYVKIDSIPAQRTYEPYLNSYMIQLLSRDSIKQPDGSYSLHYAFKPHYRSKGYIFFGAKQPDYDFRYTSDTIGDFLLCYCVDTPKQIRLKIDTLKWSYLLSINDRDTTWYFNKLVLKGKTNAISLKIMYEEDYQYYKGDTIKEYSINQYLISSKDSLLNIRFKDRADHYTLLLEAFNGLDKKIQLNPPRLTKSTLNDY